MGLGKSKLKYITITLKPYNDKKISGFKNNEMSITTIDGNTVLDVLNDLNKFRRPDNKVYCHNPEDNNIRITKEITIIVE